MAAEDYEFIALEAMGLAEYYNEEIQLILGDTRISESPAAMIAASNYRCDQIEKIIESFKEWVEEIGEEGKSARAHIAFHNHMLTTSTYMEAVQNFDYFQGQRQKADKIQEAYEIRMARTGMRVGYKGDVNDQYHIQMRGIEKTPYDYEIFYKGLNTTVQFDSSKHTPDLNGYLRYMAEQAPEFFNFLHQHPIDIVIPESARLRHTYITGGSGSGKSELLKLLIYNYAGRLKNYGAVVVIEPHGDLASEISQWGLFVEPDRLVYIDPNLEAGYTPTINPLELPPKANADVYAQELLTAFEELLAGDGGNTLTNNMRALMLPCLKVLLAMKGATFKDLKAMMGSQERATKYAAMGRKHPNEMVRDFFQHEFNDSKFSRTKDAIGTKITSITNTEAEQKVFLGKNTIDLEAAVDARKVIICRFSKGTIGSEASKALGKFIIASLKSMALRRADIEQSERVPVHLFVDECQNYVTSSMDDILRESRKYKLYLTMAQQLFGDGMNSDTRRVIMGNTQIKIAGRNQDDFTIKKMASTLKIDPEKFNNLKAGQFLTRIGEGQGFKLNAWPILIKDENGRCKMDMQPEHWPQVKAEQLQKYYRKINPELLEAPQDSEERELI